MKEHIGAFQKILKRKILYSQRRALPLLITFFLLLFFALGFPIFAEEVLLEEYGYTFNPPEGWEVLDISDLRQISFTDPDHVSVFQIITYEAERFNSSNEIADFIIGKFTAEGEKAEFVYQGTNAVFADLQFQAGSYPARGYFIFLHGFSHSYALMAFSHVDYYDKVHDQLISCLDSFSPAAEAKYYPGPVSQFYTPFPPVNIKYYDPLFEGQQLALPLSGEGAEASQMLIEREAAILTLYSEDYGKNDRWLKAWKRYYKLIYRDNYRRLEPLARSFRVVIRRLSIPRNEVPAKVLSWFQDFTYRRDNTLSDLLSPVSCLIDQAGDCDSLALSYIILLHHLGYDAILLISDVHNHSLAAVDLEGKGARFNFERKGYLIAELTEKVDIGLIDRSMADPAGWIPVRLR